MRRLRPGVAQVLDQSAPSMEAWAESNRVAVRGDGPLWLALGDSTAQGLGASAFDRGYVGQLRALLEARDGRPWRVVNASSTGARVRDVHRQLRWLDELPTEPDLITCSVGANDVLRFWLPTPLGQLEQLMRALPTATILATLPKGLRHEPTVRMNEVIRRVAPTLRLRVADVWAHTGPPWRGKLAVDNFHPNDTGYRDWVAAFSEVLGLTAA